MNPGKKDNVYVGKSNGQRQYEQKRYLLWPIRDLLNILNTPENDSYVDSYGEELPFSVLYRFLKEHKQYIFNKNVPHNACLCEICENTVLLSKGISSIASVQIPTDPHTIVEHYSCDSSLTECMQSRCDKCKNHGLNPTNFESSSKSSNSDSDDDEREKTVKFQEWKRDDNGYMMKSRVILSLEDGLELWNTKIQRLKEHIFAKRQQQSKISHLKTHLKSNEILLHVDYSENYKSKDQNEIQSAYFGQSTFSLFTACPYYRCLESDKIKTMSTTVTSEASDKSRMASMTCVSKVIEHVISEIPNSINTVYVVSDGCASQFRSRFVFKLLTTMHPEMNLEWHYNEAHHGKGPMDGIGGAVKNAVFRKVLSGAVKISSPKEFAEYVNHVSEVHSLYLPTDEIPPEPEEVANATAIPDTLKTHGIVRGLSKHGVPYLKFFFLSNDKEPHYTQWYGSECGHADNSVDENTCAFCLRKYNVNASVEWMKCPICESWFHENCFFC